MPFDDFSSQIDALDVRGLRRQRRLLESAQTAHVVVDGRKFIAFASNDYLGLAADARLIEAVCEGARAYGVGAGASHLILGHMTAHHELELALAKFTGLPRALAFSTGYMANLGIVTALAGRHDDVFADRLNHASLNDAVLLARANFRRYAHGDLAQLERLLAASTARRKLVVADAVFSMDGDIAPVPQLLELCERFDALLVLDDAHGFGVLGRNGRGVLEHFAIASPRIVYMATLGKAAGVSGAFVAGSNELIETLVQQARTYIYTTASPPLLAHALRKSLDIIAHEPARRETLAQHAAQLKSGIAGLRWHHLPSETAIQPLIIGDNVRALAVTDALMARGILVPAIRPPTVPDGTARLRISLSAAHTSQDVSILIEALHAVAREP